MFLCVFLFVTDLSRSGQCSLSLYKAAVWTVLLSPNSHLPGSILWSGFRLVVPRKVQLTFTHETHTLDTKVFFLYVSPLFIHSLLIHFLFHSVYSGHQSILIPPFELEGCLSLWLSTLSQYRIRDTFCSYSVMELCTKGLGTQTELLKVRTSDLENNQLWQIYFTHGFDNHCICVCVFFRLVVWTCHACGAVWW